MKHWPISASLHKTDSSIELKATDLASFEIILYNDDVNTFDHVIDCLMKYCKHDAQQAEQCALLVHTKGKCAVKSGDYSTLQPLCEALCENGLSAQIEMV
jgi:ATP-dependent Clp protease adaptor protein ClpS